MSACPQCGAVARPTDKFCNACGTPLARPSQAGAPAPPMAPASPPNASAMQGAPPFVGTSAAAAFSPPGPGAFGGPGSPPGPGAFGGPPGGFGAPPGPGAFGGPPGPGAFGTPAPRGQAARCQLGHDIAPGASYCPQGHPIALDQMQFANEPFGGGGAFGSPPAPPPFPMPQGPLQTGFGSQGGAAPLPSPPPIAPGFGAAPPAFGAQPAAFGAQPPAFAAPPPPFAAPPPAFGAPPPAFAAQPPPFAAPPPAPPAPPPPFAPPPQFGGAPPAFAAPPAAFAPPPAAFAAPPAAFAPPPAPFGAPPAPAFGAPPPAMPYAQPEPARETPAKILRGFLVAYVTNAGGDFWPLTGGRLTVGRYGSADGIDIALQDPTISSRHAAVVIDAASGAIAVEDTASTNGTFVNDDHIGFNGRRELRDGDRVRFGAYTALVKVIGRV